MGKKSLSIRGIIWIANLTLSVLIRIPALNDQVYWWRAIQTNMSTYWFTKEGINLFGYQTPLYGPPWQIPFEFPIYQALSAILVKIGLGNIDFCSRLAALICFYFSAWMLYLICKMIFPNRSTTLVILTVYLWTPYNIFFSTEPLIDYLALSMALGYFYFIISWFKHNSLQNVFLALTFGVLNTLIKPTTTPIIVMPLIAFTLKDIYEKGYFRDYRRPSLLAQLVRKNSYYWMALISMAVLPLLAATLWTHTADQIKETSIFTQWLTSGMLRDWMYGTAEVRSDPILWIRYNFMIGVYFLPYALSVFALTGLVGLRKESSNIKIFVTTIIASVGLTLVIFFNLFQHEYYYIVFSASMAIVAGYGIYNLWVVMSRENRVFSILIVVSLIVSMFFAANDYIASRDNAKSNNEKIAVVKAWAKRVQRHISENEWAAIVQADWDPFRPYFLERKVMVITFREQLKPICPILADAHFRLVISLDKNPDTIRTLACFKSYDEVMPGVYKVKH